MSVQKETIFLKQNLELFLKPFTLKPIKIESHLMTYFHQRQYRQIQEQIIAFQEKNQGVARFQKQMLLNLHQTIFVFKMQDQDFKIHSK